MLEVSFELVVINDESRDSKFSANEVMAPGGLSSCSGIFCADAGGCESPAADIIGEEFENWRSFSNSLRDSGCSLS